ncbi:hypothetical protein CsSME_00004238 [Camellia sinensis var. sinensis]
MDIATATATATATASVKTPEAETEAPTRIQPSKPLSFTNGVLKRHHHRHHRHHHHLSAPPVVVTYKECLKNHAASLGGHAVDGCGEFMPSPTSSPTDPTSLKCAACGCHRNFHRRDPEEPLPAPTSTAAQHHHTHTAATAAQIQHLRRRSLPPTTHPHPTCSSPSAQACRAHRQKTTHQWPPRPARQQRIPVGGSDSEQNSRRIRRRGCTNWQRELGGRCRRETKS